MLDCMLSALYLCFFRGEALPQEEESARKAAEEEARLAAGMEQRKADRAARRAEARRQGLLLTGKAKRDAERLAVQREQLLRNSGVDISGASPSAALDCMTSFRSAAGALMGSSVCTCT